MFKRLYKLNILLKIWELIQTEPDHLKIFFHLRYPLTTSSSPCLKHHYKQRRKKQRRNYFKRWHRGDEGYTHKTHFHNLVLSLRSMLRLFARKKRIRLLIAVLSSPWASLTSPAHPFQTDAARHDDINSPCSSLCRPAASFNIHGHRTYLQLLLVYSRARREWDKSEARALRGRVVYRCRLLSSEDRSNSRWARCWCSISFRR